MLLSRVGLSCEGRVHGGLLLGGFTLEGGQACCGPVLSHPRADSPASLPAAAVTRPFLLHFTSPGMCPAGRGRIPMHATWMG